MGPYGDRDQVYWLESQYYCCGLIMFQKVKSCYYNDAVSLYN
jgi:hypothetical protein